MVSIEATAPLVQAVGLSRDQRRIAFREKGRRAVGSTRQVIRDYPDEERCGLLHVGENSRTVGTDYPYDLTITGDMIITNEAL